MKLLTWGIGYSKIGSRVTQTRQKRLESTLTLRPRSQTVYRICIILQVLHPKICRYVIWSEKRGTTSLYSWIFIFNCLYLWNHSSYELETRHEYSSIILLHSLGIPSHAHFLRGECTRRSYLKIAVSYTQYPTCRIITHFAIFGEDPWLFLTSSNADDLKWGQICHPEGSAWAAWQPTPWL